MVTPERIGHAEFTVALDHMKHNTEKNHNLAEKTRKFN